ncbi:MAG: hypothetical protein GX483_08925, partial [Actinomycetaceae bacterium]|nr:hypothetical protein [Actinomycetaceae bacterium]
MLIDTIPRDARKTSSINLGFEIAREWHGLEPTHFTSRVLEVPDTIYANVFYPMNMINLVSFLKRKKIPVLKEERRQRLVVGGQGVNNTQCLSDIADEIYLGEIDGNYLENGWSRRDEIDSEPRLKEGKAVIELTRGCKYRCKFCEYGWVHGGRFREKDINLVKEQILYVLPKSNNINFM